MQEQEKVRESSEETGNLETEQEKPDESEGLAELLECFQRNSAGSACPNTAKGIFVSSDEARDLFRYV